MVCLRPGAAARVGAGRLYPAPLSPVGDLAHAAAPGGGSGGGAGGGLRGHRLRHGGGPVLGAGLPRRLRRPGVLSGSGRDGHGRGVPVCPEPVLPGVPDLLRRRAGPAGRPAGGADAVYQCRGPARSAPGGRSGVFVVPGLDPSGLAAVPGRIQPGGRNKISIEENIWIPNSFTAGCGLWCCCWP